MKGLSWVLTVAGVLLLLGSLGFTFSQLRFERVENRVQKIEEGNPCIEKGPDSPQCQRSRNQFARTITFAQACEIVKKASPANHCSRGGGRQSPNQGNQLTGPLLGTGEGLSHQNRSLRRARSPVPKVLRVHPVSHRRLRLGPSHLLARSRPWGSRFASDSPFGEPSLT